MKLNLAAIVTAAGDCPFEARAEEIDLTPPKGFDVRFSGPVFALLSTRRVGEEYFAQGESWTDGTFTCVRCLLSFDREIRTPLELVIRRVTAPQANPTEFDNYVELTLGTSEYDIAPHVREGLLLAVPQAPHCQEGCRGLCPHCGVDLNKKTCSCQQGSTDPRWDALRQFTT